MNTPSLTCETFQSPYGEMIKISTQTKHEYPIVLAHGTFCNHRCMFLLAKALAYRGYECWVFDWRNHGKFAKNTHSATFESYAHFDYRHIIKQILNYSKAKKLHWVGHSGGGLIPLMAIAKEPHLQLQLASLTMLASQATGHGESWYRRKIIKLCKLLISSKKTVQLPFQLLGPEVESAALLKQWCQWNLSKQWLSSDGFDYLKHLYLVQIPVLAIAADKDPIIAPSAGCEFLLEQCGSPVKLFISGTIDSGFSKPFSHSELITHPKAVQEVSNHIIQWLRDKSESNSKKLQA